MPLLASILHGFGFTIGARAASEMIDELAQDDEAAAAAPAPAPARARDTKVRDRDVERELRAMKKRLARESRRR